MYYKEEKKRPKDVIWGQSVQWLLLNYSVPYKNISHLYSLVWVHLFTIILVLTIEVFSTFLVAFTLEKKKKADRALTLWESIKYINSFYVFLFGCFILAKAYLTSFYPQVRQLWLDWPCWVGWTSTPYSEWNKITALYCNPVKHKPTPKCIVS